MANIWTEAGLVNGNRGYVVDVVWHADVTDPRTTVPVYVLIYFPKYTGSTLPCDIRGVPMPLKVVPIFPCRRYRTQNTTRTSTDNQWREQFPLMVSYAMTIHKSQGMTLDLAILDLKGGGTPRPLGLLYVALSLVRRLEHLAIHYPRRYLTERYPRTRDSPARRSKTGSADSPPSRGAPYATNAGSTNALSSYVLYGGVYG
ncbi:hypothetical protein E4U14_000402 [Claviceps sp. LM454 group G7]|nr:hypothetical protein E4U14_000402 [Claviceps sp. LM454 group G7]